MELLPQLEHNTVKASDVSDQGVHEYQLLSNGLGLWRLADEVAGKAAIRVGVVEVVQRPKYGSPWGKMI